MKLLLPKTRMGKKEPGIWKGLSQGCVLSPVLYNSYIQDALSKIQEDIDIGIKIQGETINIYGMQMHCYMTKSEQCLKVIIERVEDVM